MRVLRDPDVFLAHVPLPAGDNFASLRIAGMFIVGIAGMKNCTNTSASSIGLPVASFTVASSWLSPVFGGSGTVRKVIWVPAAAAAPLGAAEVS